MLRKMLYWIRSIWQTSSPEKPTHQRIRPWTDFESRELAADSQEFEMFRRETIALYCVIGQLDKYGITQYDLDDAFCIAMAERRAGLAPYQGGIVAALDQFVTKDRVIRKRADYFHIHIRETHEDLACIHWLHVPFDPADIKLIQVSIDPTGKKAIVMTEHRRAGVDNDGNYCSYPARIRWWLLRDEPHWKIYEFE